MVIRRKNGTSLLIAAALLAACRGGGDGGGEETAGGQPPLPPDLGDEAPRVVLETSMGRIVLELDREKAPRTVENILYHVENKFYDGLTFHRVIPGFMIQGGGFTPDLRQRRSPRPPIPNEANNGLRNLRGTVAMARTSEPHSATTQFFINLVDNPNLDFTSETPGGWGYAVFGKVVEGMDVVDKIAAVPTTTKGPMSDVPVDPVIIERAYVERG
jgi:cyclophilin family peptidyl-prolyl cis-trans isomerase